MVLQQRLDDPSQRNQRHAHPSEERQEEAPFDLLYAIPAVTELQFGERSEGCSTTANVGDQPRINADDQGNGPAGNPGYDIGRAHQKSTEKLQRHHGGSA